jgi:hypothetical protein
MYASNKMKESLYFFISKILVDFIESVKVTAVRMVSQYPISGILSK